MKKASTIISTGDDILYKGYPAKVGTIKNGLIQIKCTISATSCITELMSTYSINRLIKSGGISTTKESQQPTTNQ